MAIRLSKFSDAEIRQISDQCESELESRSAGAKAAAKAKLEEFAKKLGYSASDLLGGQAQPPVQKARRGRAAGVAKAAAATKAKLPPKYRSPTDPSKTWSGHGKRPDWYKAHLEAGRDADELLVKGAKAPKAAAKPVATVKKHAAKPVAKAVAKKAPVAKKAATPTAVKATKPVKAVKTTTPAAAPKPAAKPAAAPKKVAAKPVAKKGPVTRKPKAATPAGAPAAAVEAKGAETGAADTVH